MLFDEWFRTAPYQSAFAVTAFKATLADFIVQKRERASALKTLNERPDGVDIADEELPIRAATILECDEVSCNEVVVYSASPLSLQRLGTFFLYGGLYQGCVQYFLFNVMYPIWFGDGTDLATLLAKVCFDQFVLTPFLCLPACYLVKAIVFGYSLREGLQRYVADAKRDLLVKYWLLWGPVQCVTFGMVPPQWRVPFIALVSFFWLLILSTITAREDNNAAAQNAS